MFKIDFETKTIIVPPWLFHLGVKLHIFKEHKERPGCPSDPLFWTFWFFTIDTF